jgi:hypothetical protein
MLINGGPVAGIGEETGMAKTVFTKPVLKVAIALFLVVVLAGCSGGNAKGGPPGPGQNFTPDQAGRFALAAKDLPPEHKKIGSRSGRVACDSGHLANSGEIEETAGEAELRRQLLALGPEACNLSTYEMTVGEPGRQGTTGSQTMSVVFADADAASAALPLLRKSLLGASELGAPVDVDALGVGDESVAGLRWRPPAPSGVGPEGFGMSHTEVHIWRLRNVAVRLSVAVTFGMTEDDVVTIGQRLNARAVK